MTASPTTSLHLAFDPLVDPLILIAAGVILALAAVISLRRAGLTALWRLAAGMMLIALLANPSLVEEKRQRTPDIALVVVDRSPSQMIGDRSAMTDKALAYLKDHLGQRPDLELRVQESEGGTTQPVTQTELFRTVETALADVPKSRRAGVIFISDGRIADVPAALPGDHEPVHLLLTGKKDEHDLQIRLLKVPTYGLTGQSLSVKFRIEDEGAQRGRSVEVTLRAPDGKIRRDIVATGKDTEWTLPVPFPGQNVFEMQIPADKSELTAVNNRAVFSVNGVRDRLKVLLVSGEPHAGGRTWRDLFKADSGVDLIHFTILRSPQERDMTPQRELSLIAFPIRQLFEVKLKDFDLIVLDRFHLNNILPDYYFQNIRTYVEQGGALLEVSGPTFGTEESLYHTAMGAIFPTRPAGTVVQGPFRPLPTELGKIHPVTQTIARNPDWGSWLQYVPVSLVKGDILMTAGSNGAPLLILDHVGKGRIAQLASDQIWLWSRGYEGGGPTEELLRRIVHWLMKEPELEEDALDVASGGDTLTVMRRKLKDSETSVTMTAPDGRTQDLPLSPGENGWLTATLKAKAQGIYEFASGNHRRLVSYGDTSSPEMRDLIASDTALRPLIAASKGASIRLEGTPEPDIRFLPPQRDYGGKSWLGLRQNNSFVVTGTEQTRLLPPWLALLLSAGLIILAWWREGRRQ